MGRGGVLGCAGGALTGSADWEGGRPCGGRAGGAARRHTHALTLAHATTSPIAARSEHTIEENILKKSDQKRHLDFLAIQVSCWGRSGVGWVSGVPARSVWGGVGWSVWGAQL